VSPTRDVATNAGDSLDQPRIIINARISRVTCLPGSGIFHALHRRFSTSFIVALLNRESLDRLENSIFADLPILHHTGCSDMDLGNKEYPQIERFSV